MKKIRKIITAVLAAAVLCLCMAGCGAGEEAKIIGTCTLTVQDQLQDEKVDIAEGDTVEYNYAKYHDTYSDPQVAYSQVSSALNDLSKAFKSNNIGVTDTATISEAAAGKQLQ